MSEEEPTNKRDELVHNLKVGGVDLSAFVALIPTTSERPLNPTYRELVILDNDKLKAMSKKRLRRHIRALEAMVRIRDQKLRDLKDENDAQA